MALQALQSSGVAFRKILSHFPEELSLAFAYGSGVYRQAGPSSDQKVSPGGPFAFGPSRALELPGRSAHPRINSQSPDTNPTKGLLAERQRELRFQRHVGVRLGLRAGDAVMWREELVPGQDGEKKKKIYIYIYIYTHTHIYLPGSRSAFSALAEHWSFIES